MNGADRRNGRVDRADDDSENLHVLHDAIRKCYADWGWCIPKGLVQEA
ncbi:hypothetical protein [Sphingomonas sp. C3-2]|nr:hypothetical protein [Sphingomonas sp. C3-2]WOK37271.1 hypothetical protein QYC26_03520 [Sphingomonas sp. C3-2]